jgi:hypothetical protein
MSAGVVLQIVGYAAAISLQVLILQAMFRGSGRRYPFVFLYVVLDLLTNLIEIWPRLTYDTLAPAAKRQAIFVYYWDERIIQATLFLLVISLIYRASTDVHPRRILVVALVSGSLLFALVSFFIHYDPNVTTGKWMTPWTRNMNFCAAVLDLLLWATLIRTRQRDQRLLMISGALGIQFTAGAVGWALRDVSHGSVDFAAVLIVCGNLSCLYVWWQAFRLTAAPAPTAVPPHAASFATKKLPK